MKKQTPLAALLLSLAGSWAQAQSSVTLYGLMDLGVEYANAGQGRVLRQQSGQWFGSRLGFRAVEDLGGGWVATAVLEHGLTADTGGGTTFGTNVGAGNFFDRQIFLALQGGFGRIAGGVQYTLTDTVKGTVEPFTNGTSADTSPIRALNPSRCANCIIYSTPRLGGSTTLSLLVSSGSEQSDTPTSSGRAGKEMSGSVAFASGPVYLGLAYDRLYARDALTPLRPDVQQINSWILGATYDLGFMKLHGWLNGQKADPQGSGADLIARRDIRAYALGLTLPLAGVSSLRFAYAARDDKTTPNRDASKWGVGYFYDLSKRSTLYTAYSQLTNQDRFTAAGAPNGAGISLGSGAAAGVPLANANSDPKSFNLGLRHSF
jgi:predicted porin